MEGEKIALKIKTDGLRKTWAMVLMGVILTLLLPWLTLRKADTRPVPVPMAGFEDMDIQPLSESLPQCYRVEDADGTVSALTPEALLVHLAGEEWAEWTAQNEKVDMGLARQALILRMVLFHGKALGLMGDRVEGRSGEELIGAVWLRKEDMPVMETEQFQTLPAETLEELRTAAETAAPYFLSKDGRLLRDVEALTIGELYDRMADGETVAGIISAFFGEGCVLEQAGKNDLDTGI